MLVRNVKRMRVKVKERIVLREIHLRTTGCYLSMGSHNVICHPTGDRPAFTPSVTVFVNLRKAAENLFVCLRVAALVSYELAPWKCTD